MSVSDTINTSYRCVGLETIKMGDVGGKGGILGTSLITIKNIVSGSAFFAFEAPGKNEFFCEDSDYADVITNTPGAKFIEFSVRDMSPEIFKLAFGGTSAGTCWSAYYATATVVSEQSIIATSKDYGGDKLRLYITRAAVRAGGDLRFSKTETGTVTFTCEVLLPETITPPLQVAIT